MTNPVDDPRSGSAGAIPSGTDMGSAARDHHLPANRAGVSGASGSSAMGEATTTGGASGSGTMGAVPDEAGRGRASGAASGGERGGASGSGTVDDTPSGASGSSDADDDEDAGT